MKEMETIEINDNQIVTLETVLKRNAIISNGHEIDIFKERTVFAVRVDDNMYATYIVLPNGVIDLLLKQYITKS